MKPLLLVLSKSLSSSEVELLVREYSMSKEVLSAVTYIESLEHGLSFSCKANFVNAVFLYADGVEDYKKFKGPVFTELDFESTKEDVRRVMGEPVSYSTKALEFDSFHGGWDRYVAKGYAINFTYTISTMKIRLITFIAEERD